MAATVAALAAPELAAAAAGRLAWIFGGGSVIAQARDKAMEAIEELKDSGISNFKVTLSRLGSTFNALRDHLTNSDIVGVIRERMGTMSGNSHVGEVRDTMNSLNNLADQLAKQLERGSLSDADANKIRDTLQKVNALRDQIQRYLAQRRVRE